MELRRCSYHLGSPKVGPMEEEPPAPRLSGKPREVYDDNDDHEILYESFIVGAILDAKLKSCRWHPRRHNSAGFDPALHHIFTMISHRWQVTLALDSLPSNSWQRHTRQDRSPGGPACLCVGVATMLRGGIKMSSSWILLPWRTSLTTQSRSQDCVD